MANKDKVPVPAVSFKHFPQDLLDRVNAKASLSRLTQAEFIIECLEKATKDLEDYQRKVLRERDAEKKKPSKPAEDKIKS